MDWLARIGLCCVAALSHMHSSSEQEASLHFREVHAAAATACLGAELAQLRHSAKRCKVHGTEAAQPPAGLTVLMTRPHPALSMCGRAACAVKRMQGVGIDDAL